MIKRGAVHILRGLKILNEVYHFELINYEIYITIIHKHTYYLRISLCIMKIEIYHSTLIASYLTEKNHINN